MNDDLLWLGGQRTSVDEIHIEVPSAPPKSVSFETALKRKDKSPQISPRSSRTWRLDFDFATEQKKAGLVDSVSLVVEPLDRICEALVSGDSSELTYLPNVLDYFADELRSPSVQVVSAPKQRSETFLVPLSNDRQYAPRKRVSADPSRTTAEEEWTAPVHLQLAIDLMGSVPWPNYAISQTSFLNAGEVVFHRRHIICPFSDSDDVPWPVSGGRSSEDKSVVDSVSDVSLRDPQNHFILLEYSEQNPLLLPTTGMAGCFSRFWRPRMGRNQPDNFQLEGLGPFGQLKRLDGAFLPRVYGGSTVRVDSHALMFESSLLRAPLFMHKTSKTDFLLVRYRQGGRVVCILRSLPDHTYLVGQSEPVVRVDPPVPPKVNGMLRARVLAEAKKFWKSTGKLITPEIMRKFFLGENRAVLSRFCQEANREILEAHNSAIASLNSSNGLRMSPEDHCRLESMRVGLLRLRQRGIRTGLSLMNVARVRQYVQEIESHERFVTDPKEKVAHHCLQLEHELQLTPWNLTADYFEVVFGRRGALFSFAPIGDPSGGRGEGLSYLKVPKEQEKTDDGDLRAKTKTELLAELKKRGVQGNALENLSRWELLRKIRFLISSNSTNPTNSEPSRVPIYQRKQQHMEKINAIWRRQAAALSSPLPPANPGKSIVPPITGSIASQEEDLADDLLADILGSNDVQELQSSSSSEDDEKELAKFRMGGKPSVEKVTPIEPVARLPCLRVVHSSREKKGQKNRTTFVYGLRNIALYRRWRKLNFESVGVDDSTKDMGNGLEWERAVEEALALHKKLQLQLAEKIIQSSDPRAKRCQACHWLGHDSASRGCPMYQPGEEGIEDDNPEEEDEENGFNTLADEQMSETSSVADDSRVDKRIRRS